MNSLQCFWYLLELIFMTSIPYSILCPLEVHGADLGLILFEPVVYVNSDVLRQLTLSRIKLSGKEIHNFFLDFFIGLLQEIKETLFVSKQEIVTTD